MMKKKLENGLNSIAFCPTRNLHILWDLKWVNLFCWAKFCDWLLASHLNELDFIKNEKKTVILSCCECRSRPQNDRNNTKARMRKTADGTINSDIYQYVGLIIQLITIWYRCFCFFFFFHSSLKLVCNFLWNFMKLQRNFVRLKERVQ